MTSGSYAVSFGTMSTMSRRTKAEIQELDSKIRPLYEQGIGCRTIAASIGEHSAMVYKRVRSMGILRTRTDADQGKVATIAVPFSRQECHGNLSSSAIGIAIRWFMERGYMASVPVEPTRYDLVVESDEGLKRIQVKTTTTKDHGRWIARISRYEYDASIVANASGKRRHVPYSPGEIDLFFIVTGDHQTYLIPFGAVEGKKSLTLDTKYQKYQTPQPA